MKTEQLRTFFHLEENIEAFNAAIKPPSCGGRDSFEKLAAKGDVIINSALIERFKRLNIIKKGEIALKKQEFHNARTLIRIGRESLELQTILNPLDRTYQIKDSDIKETIEALLGATNDQNGEQISFQVVEQLYEIAANEKYLDLDYISTLGKLIQNDPEFKEMQKHQGPGVKIDPLKWGKPYDEGTQTNHQWKIDLTVKYGGNEINKCSDPFTNTEDAKRDVAKKILEQIFGSSDLASIKKTAAPTYEVKKQVSSSYLQKEITFVKDNFEDSFSITKGTQLSLPDWAIQKAVKTPFEMLLLLSAILPTEFLISSWSNSIKTGDVDLIVLNIQFNHQNLFEIGYNTDSKTQARKDAALRIIERSGLYAWLKTYHGNDLK